MLAGVERANAGGEPVGAGAEGADAVRLLSVVEPSQAERLVPSGPDPVTIGRDPSCTIRLQSPYVSRLHARIEARDGKVVIVDLGSHNGVLLNGQRIERRATLRPGDQIGIADARLVCLAQAVSHETTRALGEDASAPDAAPPQPPDSPQAERLHVDAQVHQVWVGGRLLERRLSVQEFALARYLYEHRERVCTREELGNAIWGARNWDPNMLHNLVRRLKEKLEPNPEKPRYLETVPWVGYRLIA